MSETVTERRSMDITNTWEYIKLRDKYARLKMENAQLQTKLGEAEKARESAVSEAGTAKTKYDESKLKAENADLKGQLRSLNHRRIFDRLADDRKVPTDARDLLWQASGWKAEKDDVDEAAMGTLLDEMKARPGVSRLFGGEPETPTPPAPHGPAPGRGQGGRDEGNGKFRVTMAQISDDAWVYQNQKRYQEAAKSGNLEIID